MDQPRRLFPPELRERLNNAARKLEATIADTGLEAACGETHEAHIAYENATRAEYVGPLDMVADWLSEVTGWMRLRNAGSTLADLGMVTFGERRNYRYTPDWLIWPDHMAERGAEIDALD